jgi:hypothetical protein
MVARLGPRRDPSGLVAMSLRRTSRRKKVLSDDSLRPTLAGSFLPCRLAKNDRQARVSRSLPTSGCRVRPVPAPGMDVRHQLFQVGQIRAHGVGRGALLAFEVLAKEFEKRLHCRRS